jgi:hypothetical protein
MACHGSASIHYDVLEHRGCACSDHGSCEQKRSPRYRRIRDMGHHQYRVPCRPANIYHLEGYKRIPVQPSIWILGHIDVDWSYMQLSFYTQGISR